jgi:hypothetical protein
LPPPLPSGGGPDTQLAAAQQPVKKTTLPPRGFFAEADPRAEVYAKGPAKFDPRKKPGRYGPEFIWQTDWQAALALQVRRVLCTLSAKWHTAHLLAAQLANAVIAYLVLLTYCFCKV